MSSTLWEDVIAEPSMRHLLVGRVDTSFARGRSAKDGNHSVRLQSAVSLMARCCRKLKLQGLFALEGRVEEGELQVQIVMDDEVDFFKLGLITLCRPTPPGAWKSQSYFVLDEALYAKLLETTRMPDDEGMDTRT